MRHVTSIARHFSLTLGIVAFAQSVAISQDTPIYPELERPIQLQADGNVIDTGRAWGHSAPCIEDIDGDGLPDLVLGDFSGKFHYYRNVGSSTTPRFESAGLLKAGNKAAEVWIYCCIGGQARFCDLNGDGIRDFLSNSYDPGHCYVFWGLPDHRFSPREELTDKAGVPIRSFPKQKREVQSFGSFYEFVDWDGDGDFDILIGCFSGDLKLRLNEGTSSKPSFADESIDVVSDEGPVKVKAHFCPKVADWDGDGLWDILAGSDDGSVTWFRNIGALGRPAFGIGEVLVQPHAGHGYNILSWDSHHVKPGIRSQIEVVDFNGDGKQDLLVGDFYTAFDCRTDLTSDQKEEVDSLIEESNANREIFADSIQKLRDSFQERFPGELSESKEAEEVWQSEYSAMMKTPEIEASEAREAELAKSLRPFLQTTRGNSDAMHDLANSHGHVWLYLRK